MIFLSYSYLELIIFKLYIFKLSRGARRWAASPLFTCIHKIHRNTREMAPFDLSFDAWRALARVDFPFVTCRTHRSIHGSHDLFQNFMKIYSFHHMSHVSIDTCSRRDFSSFSRGPREHRCVASVARTCAAHEPSHVAHVEGGNRHVRGS